MTAGGTAARSSPREVPACEAVRSAQFRLTALWSVLFLDTAAATLEPSDVSGTVRGDAAGLVEVAPGARGRGGERPACGAHGRQLPRAPLLRQAEGRETSRGDSCFSSVSFITVGSARLSVAFRTNPISLFIALGFPFFISITLKHRNCFRGENRLMPKNPKLRFIET